MPTNSSAAIDSYDSTLQLPESESANLIGFRGNRKDAICADGSKVLLLEDDPEFTEIIADFFKENGFDVTAVKSGVQGVHMVMESDYDVVVCDMMMPTVPGDMFFRAVELLRPYLCDRFIFMTGYRGNSKIDEFIDSVSGTMLAKPFQMDDLKETIAFVRVRNALLLAA